LRAAQNQTPLLDIPVILTHPTGDIDPPVEKGLQTG